MPVLEEALIALSNLKVSVATPILISRIIFYSS